MAGESLVERLRRLDACAVSDACDQLSIDGCVSTALRPTTGPGRIAGKAITVRLGPPSNDASNAEAAELPEAAASAARHLCAAATDAATTEHVIVVAHQGRSDCAGWGGNLSRAARHRGAAGTIVDGAVRDVDEAIEVGYPVFATGATPRTARGRAEEKAWGETVTLDGITVDHGDYVLADSSGTVFIRASDIDRVLGAAEIIAAKEASMAADLEAGKAVSDVMGGDYESMLE